MSAMILSNKSSVSVVIPEAPTTREQFAAQEAAKYLRLVFSGISVNIAADAENTGDLRILIGGPERNTATAAYISEVEFDKLVPGPEGMFIKALK